jgi:prepilin-type N-terminal cleavage/methylation domain-containing protein
MHVGALLGRPSLRRAFSLIEIMMVVALLTLIMVALMSVFSSTQTAFRASITQTDVLEGSRAAMDLLTSDLRQMAPSGGYNATLPLEKMSPFPLPVNNPANPPSAALNFWVSNPWVTVLQSLVGVANGQTVRTNLVQSIFIMTYQNQLWRGIGYFVDTNSNAHIDPLYRYDSSLQIARGMLPARPSPLQIFTNFCFIVASTSDLDNGTNAIHLLDGVVHFNVRACDTNGVWLTNGFTLGQPIVVPRNTTVYASLDGETSLFMCSNTLPAAVEIQMGVLEDRTLQRASTFPAGSVLQSNYLAQQAGKVHLFRQRVTIPNVDFTAYQ